MVQRPAAAAADVEHDNKNGVPGLAAVPLKITAPAVSFGFSAHQAGGHMARSMMLSDLAALVASVPADSSNARYFSAIVDENLLGKPTFSSRRKSYRHLVELYGLDPSLVLFATLRRFADDDPRSLPLLALTCVFCRDPQLRASFSLIENLSPGEVLPRERMEAHLENAFPGRFSAATKKSLAQNVNTTWTASGHLAGHAKKRRARPAPVVGATAYAMFAGNLLGLRGEILLSSVFGRLVAVEPATAIAHLAAAARSGWLRLRHAGGVTEIDFSALLAMHAEDLLSGAH